MYSEKRQFGNIGENAACMFLEKHGFTIVERNYLKKWGEIDIVATTQGKKGALYHFIGVKSVTHVTNYRPEDNLHPGKLKRLYRTIETYLLDREVYGDWQIDLVTVRINREERTAKCELLKNLVG